MLGVRGRATRTCFTNHHLPLPTATPPPPPSPIQTRSSSKRGGFVAGVGPRELALQSPPLRPFPPLPSKPGAAVKEVDSWQGQISSYVNFNVLQITISSSILPPPPPPRSPPSSPIQTRSSSKRGGFVAGVGLREPVLQSLPPSLPHPLPPPAPHPFPIQTRSSSERGGFVAGVRLREYAHHLLLDPRPLPPPLPI